MPPKPSTKRTKSTLEKDEESQYALRAVVLCDVYASHFEPMSAKLHPILLPLAGTPILAYTLEFLERGGVEEIILVCSMLSSQVQKYIEGTRWGEPRYPVKVKVVALATASSTGEALREIDRLGLVKSDFVLVRGGVLSNLPLPSIVEEHRKRRDESPEKMLMTMVTMQTESHSAFDTKRDLRESRIHVFDEENSTLSMQYDFHQCLLSEPIPIYPDRKTMVQLSKDVTRHHTNLVFRNDLYDCNIDICTPEVPALFTENFDYEDLRRDFVNGVLTSDLISKNIYCYVGKSGYTGNVTNFDEYWRISRDITTGVTSPFDPSMNLENDQTFTKRGSIWQEKNVSLASTQLKNSVVGSQTTIGAGAVITNSIIGRNCTISPGAVIQDSILWSDITVNQGVKVNRSIVAANNTIPSNCQINGGVIILPNSSISDENIPENKSFTVYGKPPTEATQDVFQDDSDSDEPIPISTLNLTDSEISEIGSDSDSEDDHSSHRRRRSSASGISIASSHNEFYDEAEESLARAFLENHSVENATIELKTLRMATNVTFHEVREAIVWALMNILIHEPKRVQTIFGKWGALLSAFTEDREAQVDIVFIVQHYFGRVIREGVIADRRRFVLGLQRLYDVDVLEEESILRWAEDKRASGVGEKWSEDMAALRKSADSFITWLKEAEEESEG